MAIQERNSEMVSLLSADFVGKADTSYLMGIITGNMLSIPGLVAFWPMSVAVGEQDDIYLNDFTTGNVLLVNGGGKVGIGQNSGPNYLLDTLHAAGAGSIARFGQLGISNGLTVSTNGTTLTMQMAGILGEGWIGVDFYSGWSNYNSGWTTGQYKKFGDLVMIRGLIQRLSGVLITMFILPAGYRPAASCMFATNTSTTLSRIDINSGGVASLVLGDTAWVSIDNIVFSTV